MILKVGEVFTPIQDREEGVFFHADAAGYMLIYNFCDPTDKEIAQLESDKPFEIAFATAGCTLWILTKCGGLSWVDAPFHPALSPDWTKLEMPEANEGHALTLLMTDASSGVVKNIRLIGLGHQFSIALLEVIRSMADAPFDPVAYQFELSRIMAAYSTERLLDLASTRWKIK